MAIPLHHYGHVVLHSDSGCHREGTIGPLLMTLAIKEVAVEYRATAMGFYQSIYALGMTLGPVVMGMIGDALGLRLGFSLLGVLGMVARV